MSGLLAKKLGMSRLFLPNGKSVAVTVLQAGPCYVTAIRTREKNGYDAVQMGFEEAKEKNLTKPRAGQFKQADVKPLRHVREFRTFPEVSKLKVGDELNASLFQEGERVKIRGISKGKGFQGVVKRHGFGGGPKTHGQSDRYRAPGSVGSSSYPSRVLKGIRMAGRMGNDRVTVRNMQVVKVDADNHIVMVKGAVPGAKNGLVLISK